MARTLEEAKKYLISKTREIAEEMLPSSMLVSVKFSKSLDKFVAITSAQFWDEGPRNEEESRTRIPVYKSAKEHSHAIVTYDINTVDINKHNIENQYFTDLIKHELAHAVKRYNEWNRIKRGEQEWFSGEHHGNKEYREIVKKYTGDVISASRITPEEHKSALSYFGSKYGYGYVPTALKHAYLQKCMTCGTIRGVTEKTECQKCNSPNTIIVKKLTPEEAARYISRLQEEDERSIPFQEYLRKKYARYVEKIPVGPHKARRRVKPMKVKAKPKILRNPNILKNLQKFM